MRGRFVDPTVGRFPGAPTWVVADTLDARWQGEPRAWQPATTWRPGKADEVDALLDRARRQLTLDTP